MRTDVELRNGHRKDADVAAAGDQARVAVQADEQEDDQQLGPPERPKNLLDFLASTASQPARAHLPAGIVDDIAAATTAA